MSDANEIRLPITQRDDLTISFFPDHARWGTRIRLEFTVPHLEFHKAMDSTYTQPRLYAAIIARLQAELDGMDKVHIHELPDVTIHKADPCPPKR